MFDLVMAYAMDLVIGDPRWLPHPVRWIGSMIKEGEVLARRYIQRERLSGIILSIGIIGLIYLFVKGFLYIMDLIHPLTRTIMGVILVFFSLSIKDLSSHATSVYIALKEGELPMARVCVGRIVGRDTFMMDEGEVIRATVESVAENTVDGVIAPMFYAMIGGPALALTYKVVNTLDSMIGYKDKRYERFGWAAARLDDLLNFIPARISALLIPLSALILMKNFKNSLLTIIRDAKNHPSPNAGIPQAGVAGALGLRLGGVNYYHGRMEKRPFIGRGVVNFSSKHIIDSVSIMKISSLLMLFGCLLFHHLM